MDNVVGVDHNSGLDNLRTLLYHQSRWDMITVLNKIVEDIAVRVVLKVNIVVTFARDPSRNTRMEAYLAVRNFSHSV